MDQKHSLLCEGKEWNGKQLTQQLDEGKNVTEEELQRGKERPTSHVAVQTKHEQTKVRKAPCVMVQVQQQLAMGEAASCATVTVQWNGGGEVPEVIVQVQQQGQTTDAPCVTVEVDQEWESAGQVPGVTVKMQQQRAERELPCPCVTVRVQQKSPGEGIPYNNVNCQHTRSYEAAPCSTQEPQQTQDKTGMVSAEMKPHQQNQERANMIDSEPLEQGGMASLVEKSLLQQCRWDHNAEQPSLVQLVQSDHKENNQEEETVKTETPLHAASQDGKPTNPYQWNVTEEDKETTTDQHKGDGNTFVQQQLSSDEGVPKVTAEEQVKKDRQEERTVSKKHGREAPNYFVAIPITNDQILDKIEDVQELIFTKEPGLLKALIPVQTMHLTIIVAHLRTEDDLKRKPTARNANPIEGLQCNGAVSALEHSKAKVEALLQGKCFSMTFRGIGQFNNQVIYVKMSEDEQQMLSKIAEVVDNSFIEKNVDITGSKYFKPHLTFLKLSKAPSLRRKGFRKIREDLYMEYEDSLFGTEIFSRIDLCAMHKKKQDSGYYHCECSINVYPTNSQDNKNGELWTDLDENIPLNDAMRDLTSATPVDGDLAPQNNLQLPEHLDGDSATTSSEENGLNKRDADTRAKGEMLTADRQVCSTLLPELLPANPKALKAKDEEHSEEKADRW
ncbi:hypothetical protein lerEdw1_012640 [Lerista edwardsae]|nr:hypothetical protein lerEdw1_012640 [Lerista edwardsae]